MAYQKSLDGIGGVARTLLSRQRSRDWDDNFAHPFTDDEIDAIRRFLLDHHRPLSRSTEKLANKVPRAHDTARVTSSVSSRIVDRPSAEPIGSTATVPTPASTRKGPARNMARWSAEEEGRLRQAFEAGRSPEAIASEFGRTAKALRLRAQKMGLIGDVADWR